MTERLSKFVKLLNVKISCFFSAQTYKGSFSCLALNAKLNNSNKRIEKKCNTVTILLQQTISYILSCESILFLIYAFLQIMKKMQVPHEEEALISPETHLK